MMQKKKTNSKSNKTKNIQNQYQTAGKSIQSVLNMYSWTVTLRIVELWDVLKIDLSSNLDQGCNDWETVTNDYPLEIVNAWVNRNEPHLLSQWYNIDHDFIFHFLAQTDF